MISIFFVPDIADNIAKELWILDFNNKVRDLKSWADNVSEDMLQVKQTSEHINEARDTIWKVNETIKKTQDAVTEKIDQTNKVIDSTQKVIDSTKQLKQDINTLTTLSWSEK